MVDLLLQSRGSVISFRMAVCRAGDGDIWSGDSDCGEESDPFSAGPSHNEPRPSDAASHREVLAVRQEKALRAKHYKVRVVRASLPSLGIFHGRSSGCCQRCSQHSLNDAQEGFREAVGQAREDALQEGFGEGFKEAFKLGLRTGRLVGLCT